MLSIKKAAVLSVVGMSVLAGLTVAPAQAATTASCTVYIRGSDENGVGIVCGPITPSSGRARGRGDCPASPDVYTPWVAAYQGGVSGWCWTWVNAAILEVK